MDQQTDAVDKCLGAAAKKLNILNHNVFRYILLCVLAGAYLTIVGFVFWNIKQNLGVDPSSRLISSLFFGVGLSIIVFTGTELFTSNNMYLTISALAKKNTVADTVKLWTVCWIGNFAGAIIIALLLAAAGSIASIGNDHAILTAAHHKADMPASEIFFKGIFANWIVCLAVWVSLHLKEETSKILSIILIVFVFLYLGFEHAIANMGTFAIAFLADPTLTLAGIGHNLLWSTLGNIMGGAVGLGVTSWVLKPKSERASLSLVSSDSKTKKAA